MINRMIRDSFHFVILKLINHQKKDNDTLVRVLYQNCTLVISKLINHQKIVNDTRERVMLTV